MFQEATSRRFASRCPARLRLFGISLIAYLVVGCGSNEGLNRQAISGVVTLDGQPLGDGAILLEPASNQATVVGATVRRGAFSIARDQGPVPGSYRVRIYASSGVQPPPVKGQTDRTRRPMVERIPDIYNTRTELRADVIVDGENRYRFELRSPG